MLTQNGPAWRTPRITRWNYGEFRPQRGGSSFYCYTVLSWPHWSSLQQDKISSTSEHAVLMLNFTHFTLGVLKQQHFALQKHHFALFSIYFLQLFLKLKMRQCFNTIPSKCLCIYIHLCQVGLKSTGLELVISEITGAFMLPSTCHWNWCQQLCRKNLTLRKSSAEVTVWDSVYIWVKYT